ncbi:MAG: ComEC/Rec2 family competence protein [Balneolaceae bacterium]|nr:ComEC/Rec2 family competence protein [Balneolaceae bacterium]
MGSQTTYRFPFASYPAVRIALLLITGILISRFFSIPIMFWGIVLFSFAAFFFLFNYLSTRSFNTVHFRLSIIFYLFLTVSFGGFWHAFQTNSQKPLTQNLLDIYTWETIRVEGELHSLKQTNTGKFQLDVETLGITFSDSVKTTSPVNIRAVWNPDKMPLPDNLSLGDQIAFEATVYPLEAKRNPYQFDYKNYLASLDIFTQVGVDSVIFIQSSKETYSWSNIRQATLNLIDQNFGSETQSLAKALLIGYKNELDRDEKIAFSRVGLSHIMAVSGLHVGFLLAPFWFLIPYVWTFKYGRQIGLIFLIGLLFFYAGLTGFSASVTRASITGGFIMYGRLFNKVRDTINLTALAAVIILLFDPAELFEIGFQLSFGAVYIILLVMPAINKTLPPAIRFRWHGKLLMIILVSIVVQVGLFPLLSYYFGEFSLIGPLANAIVIPGLTIIVPYALFLLLLSAVSPCHGSIAQYPCRMVSSKP